MGGNAGQHEQLVRALLAYLQDHLQDKITIADLAKHAGYSIPWVDKFFKKETGQSPFERLWKLRIGKAKDLLLNSHLSITEIAYDVGFDSHNRFSTMFKKQEGITPTEYRKKARACGEAPVSVGFRPAAGEDAGRIRFQDLFAEPELNSNWKQTAGQWRIFNGELSGKGEEGFQLTCIKPLPENFEIRFDFCFIGGLPLRLFLNSGYTADSYLRAEIGNLQNGTATFIFPHLDQYWSYNARITPGVWQKIVIGLRDDTVRIAMDGVEILCAKDPFPPEYAVRCRFEIAGWQSEFRIKHFVVRDFGFSPTVPAIRQADTLYRNAIFDRALDAYLRLLESASKQGEISELQYKIGMCCLRQNAFMQARSWFGKILAGPETDFWRRFAQHSNLEALFQQRDFTMFLEKARMLFARQENRNAVRACIERAKNELLGQGFFERAFSFCETLSELEEPDSLNKILAELPKADLLFNLRKYSLEIALLRRTVSHRNFPHSFWVQTHINIADALCYSGDFAGSEDVLVRIRKQAKRQYEFALCNIIHGANLRGQQRFEEAVSILNAVLGQHTDIVSLGIFAGLMASNILCLLGKPEEASDLIRQLESRFPGNGSFLGFHASSFLYPPLLLQGKFENAGEALLTGAKQSDQVYHIASQMVRAGVLFELGGNKSRAVELWSEVTRRFLPDRCCFFSELAQSFMKNQSDILDKMPNPAFDRAEMLYLAGLLYRKRNEKDNAQTYFSLAIAEDPTLNWFTWMARKETGTKD